jgi:hypothetical protein
VQEHNFGAQALFLQKPMLAHIEQYIRQSPKIYPPDDFGVLYTQEEDDLWLAPKYDWQNQTWRD